LQNLTPGEKVLVSRKPTGTLVLRDLRPGKRLYLFSTGTGLAPFLSLVKDPEMYERFEKIILVHGVRRTSVLAYEEYLSKTLVEDEHIGEEVRAKLVYYPTVTREPYRNRGRLTDLITSGQLCRDIGQPELNSQEDRAMICGSPSMLSDLSALLNERNFVISPHIGEPGDYLIERAFVEK
jgi:ferredoxin--NADP+ reductase